MKWIACILLIFICSKCFGQKDALPYTDTLGENMHYDTVGVMMLICDTSMFPIKFSDHVIMVKWQYGYEVHLLSGIKYWERLNKWIEDDSIYDTKYLDFNKQNLNKNIVVWQTIEIK